ncbi:hypothetical protein [Streptomyces nanshensis]|uniref:Uncharacterized protein n=1 Tax=Streptomyces nanshensis TaxID=518642 RepID=A0A1E7L5S4_9ACTN|nr:hypothetical protein [Streptomyces nanshensis]OEV11524.1 hypothetical protein AN218_12535 [Streptomyces nanshensis]
MTWNWLQIDLTQALGAGRAEVTCGPGRLIYEAARLDVQERLNELTGQDAGFRGANRSWRKGEDFVMAKGLHIWAVFEEIPGEPSDTTGRRFAEKMIARLRAADHDATRKP